MSDNRFKISVYQQDNDDLNEMCQPATLDWLDERIKILSEKLNLSEEQIDRMIDIKSIKADSILNGDLQDTNKKSEVLFFPGGKSTRYSETLGKKGAEKIRDYVEKGGMYYGICAGAFYASKKMDYYSLDRDRVKRHKTKSFQDEEAPLLGIIDVACDGDPANHYGEEDPKVTKGGFVEIKSNDGETAFVFTSLHLLGPFMEALEDDGIKGTALYGKHIYQNELAGVVSNFDKGDVSIIGFHPEMTPKRMDEIRIKHLKKTGKELPILMADGRNYDNLSRSERDDIKNGCNNFSDNAFLPDLFNKFCNHLKDNFSNEIDLEKVNEVQEDLQQKIGQRPYVKPHYPTKEEDPKNSLSEKDQQRFDDTVAKANSLSCANPKEKASNPTPTAEAPKQTPKEEVKQQPIQAPKPPKV